MRGGYRGVSQVDGHVQWVGGEVQRDTSQGHDVEARWDVQAIKGGLRSAWASVSCFGKGGVAVGEMSPLSETWTKGMVGDVGLARDDGHPLQPRQGDRQGNANVGPHLSSVGSD